MITRKMVRWGLVLILVGLPQALLAEMKETPVASIELEREIHFVTPEEENVIVPPGFYTVEATENGLQLIHGLLPDEGGEAFLLQATLGTHEESVESPIARSISVEEDAHYLTLLLPEGQSLVVIGSYSGVRPRGDGWFERLSQKAEKALVAVKGKYEEMTEWNRLCKKRYTKANDINTCCTSKYNSCKRVCRKKGQQRVSCQQQCETLNEGCWIRRDPNPNWMVNYCGKTKNQRQQGMTACCQRMEKRCKQSCQSFPKSGRAEFCGRCTKAANLCRNDRQEVLDVKGGGIEKNQPEIAGAGECTNRKPKKTSRYARRCEKGTACKVWDPPRSNRCQAMTKRQVPVDFTYFGKNDCRANYTRNGTKVTMIVIHNGDSAKSNKSIWECRYAASHYTIDRDGKIYQHIGEERIAPHAGKKKKSKGPNVNKRSIGIELQILRGWKGKKSLGSCNSNTEIMAAKMGMSQVAVVRQLCTPTPEQYASLRTLIEDIKSRHPISEDGIIGHCEVHPQKNQHGDPRAFDWRQIGLSNEKKLEYIRKNPNYCGWYHLY